MKTNRQARKSQLISPFGVGSIYDIGEESLTCCDISMWKMVSEKDEIRLSRLERKLKVERFYSPPVAPSRFSSKAPTVPFYRFPQWMFCPSCRQMTRTKPEDEKKGYAPVCSSPSCREKALVPMRFVLACDHGHLQDVPWDYWVHSRNKVSESGRCERPNLYFKTKAGVGGGLNSIEVHCKTCNQSNSLAGIQGSDTFQAIGVKCGGKQPWQRPTEAVECDSKVVGIQRGGSNLYYPSVVSALDIPSPGIDLSDDQLKDDVREHAFYPILLSSYESDSNGRESEVVINIAKQIAANLSTDYQKVLDIVAGTDSAEDIQAKPKKFDEKELLAEEWPSLYSPPKDVPENFPYIAERVNLTAEVAGKRLAKLIDRVVLVKKLREVRAFKGFHRISPGDVDSERMIKADLGKGRAWLPAVEVFGEGIFIAFSEAELDLWRVKNSKALKSRLELMLDRWENAELAYLPEPTAKFVAIHTFAHLFIRQLSFECGYSSSSLRERIYCSEAGSEYGAMSGVLIYTADSDSEGSLGGLVRQGEPSRLVPTIISALRHGAWCSADPICGEMNGQGLHGLNMAACHACSLVSETSCVYSNTLLDRKLLVDADLQEGGFGLMSGVLAELTGKSK